jgi:hypothetical protein
MNIAPDFARAAGSGMIGAVQLSVEAHHLVAIASH